MKRKNTTEPYPFFILLISSLCFLMFSCAPYRPARVGSGDMTEPLSVKGTGHEFFRGVTNIAFCWLEIPHEIEAGVRESTSTGSPFGIVSPAFAFVIGALNGTVWGVERAIGGAFEVVLSPFPPYGPIMRPAYPPYLNFKKEVVEQPEHEVQPR